MNYAVTEIEKIRALSLELADIESAILTLKESIDHMELIAEGEAALDPNNRNEKQRLYAAAQTLQMNEAYGEAKALLAANLKQRGVLTAELEYSRNMLSVRKLAQQERIARLSENVA